VRKWIFITALTLASANAAWAKPPAEPAVAGKLTPSELATWPRMRATDFGCMLEKRFGVRDKRYGCGVDFERIDWGDGCSGENYNAGPELPLRVAGTLPAPITSVSINWEHGEMQSVFVDFDRTLSEGDIDALLGLHIDGPMPDNIMSAGIQECLGATPCKTTLSMQGFEHMGAADLECDKPPAKQKR